MAWGSSPRLGERAGSRDFPWYVQRPDTSEAVPGYGSSIMKLIRFATALAAGALLALAGCVTTEDALQRVEQSREFQQNAPQWFKAYWKSYLQEPGPIVFALALDGSYAYYYRCSSGPSVCSGVSAATGLAVTQCQQGSRTRSRCDVYAKRRSIVWKHAIPWGAGVKPVASTPPKTPSMLSTRTVATTWEGYADVMTGQVSFEVGRPGQSQQIIMVLDDGKMTCDGSYHDRRATWTIECTNGRLANGRFVGLGAGKGARGTGTDSLGNKVQFIMGAAQ